MARKRKNKFIAALLAFFLGSMGIHRFYLGDGGGGIFYLFLLFMTTKMMFPITGMLGVFEAIRFLSMSQLEFDRKYNRVATRETRRTQRRRSREEQRGRRVDRRAPQKTSRLKSNPFKNSGLKKLKNYELDGAEEDLVQAIKINDGDVDIHYALASVYSLTEEKDKAYYHLQEAVQLGMQNLDKINTDDALAFLRIQDDFDDFRKSGFVLKKGSLVQKQEKEANLLDDDVLLSQLNKLAELRKKGLLSESEFVHERKKLLRR